MELYYEASVSSNIKELMQARTNEKIICNLMNKSTIIFQNHYTRIADQSNNQPDFVDEFGKKYDAKLLFEQKQCKLISKGLSYLNDWTNSILAEIDESSHILLYNSGTKITDTTLYREIVDRLNSIESDEAAILFFPFPIVPESKNSVHMRDVTDILSMTYNAVCQNTKKKDIETYIIYTSVVDQEFVLRDLDNDEKEYLPWDDLEKYITYSMHL